MMCWLCLTRISRIYVIQYFYFLFKDPEATMARVVLQVKQALAEGPDLEVRMETWAPRENGDQRGRRE